MYFWYVIHTIPWEMTVIDIIFLLMFTMKINIVIFQQKNYYCLLVADVAKKGKEEWYMLKLHTKGFLFVYFFLKFTKIPWEMTVIDIIFWLMYTMIITIIIIKQKLLCLLVPDVTKKWNKNDMFWSHKQNYFYSYIFICNFTKIPREIQVINIIF